MKSLVVAFVLGVCWTQTRAELPAAYPLAGLAALCCLPLLVAWGRQRWRRFALPVAIVGGACWAAVAAEARLAQALADADEGVDVELVGVIAELPQHFENGVRFRFHVETAARPVPSRLLLAWYRGRGHQADATSLAPPELHAGERWQLRVRLKKPHGNLNPHGFDYEAWLLEQGIRATGYVRTAETNARIDVFVRQPAYVVERLREAIRERFRRVLGDAPHAGVLTALAVGDQRAIDAGRWETFARTGTTHLMSISGLHVTMLAGLGGWLALALWRRSSFLALRLPAQKAAALAGLATALAYCLLSGFAVPAQRTLYMLAVVVVALWSGRALAGSTVLALALLAVVAIDPWAVLAPGFWLSFGAVALLFYVGSGRLGKAHWLAAWMKTQWAITVGMIPALLALFQQFSLVSPLANAVAIPVVSFVVTPLALAGALPLGDLFLGAAHGAMVLLMRVLSGLADWPLAVWQQAAPPFWAVLLALAGMVWLLLPRGVPARWLGLVASLPLVLLPAPRPEAGAARIVVLDVGQGLAVHVQTAHHDLLYDTGPAFSADANSGNRIVVPYLRAVGVRRLDALVVTHADTDHSGGAESVIEALPVDVLIDSLPFEHPLAAAPVAHRECAAGDAWQWDGVRFEFLHPPAAGYAAPTRRSNDMSCVLKVTAGDKSMLLTADIEALSENLLLAESRGRLRADVLLVPHHGSRTSSTEAFVAAVAPAVAVFPVGYRNRFGHPKPDVAARYAAARQLRTDRDGAVSVDLDAGGVRIGSERERRWRYWHGQ